MTSECSAARRTPTTPRRRRGATAGRRAPAFTLAEALVATALLVATMLVVSEVFSLSSNASGRTVAHTEIIEAAQTFEQAVRTRVAQMKKGLLIIESPEALLNRGDLPASPALLPMRHDRLVFIAQGGQVDFESVTDRNAPSINNPLNNGALGTGRTFTAPEALVFFGPSYPDGRILASNYTSGVGVVDTTIAGKEWIVAQRAVLLGGPTAAFTSYATLAGAGINTPAAPYRLADIMNAAPAVLQGVYGATMDAVNETGDQLLQRIQTELAAGRSIEGLWQLGLCPSTVQLDVNQDNPLNKRAYYSRAAFNLQPRIADLRIEWTDGSAIDPVDIAPTLPPPAAGHANPTFQQRRPDTQWFGPPRLTSGNAGWTAPQVPLPPNFPPVSNETGDVCAKWQWLLAFGGVPTISTGEFNTYGQVLNFPNSPELRTGNGPGGLPVYRAVWTPKTWDFRPKALRFTFRAYDSQDRIANVEQSRSNVDALNVPANFVTPTPKRYGLEFSFVVNVP